MENMLYHICRYNRLPEDEPPVSKHVEDINSNTGLEKGHFVGVYCTIV
jgi:hypothetical protein